MTTALSYLTGAVLGACVGSFLGVVIERGTSNQKINVESIVFGRSRCSGCRRRLTWWENVPLLSYLYLGGRCRTCLSPIPYWLPLVEIAGAIGGIWVTGEIGRAGIISALAASAIAFALVWIFFSDLVNGAVPDWAVVVGSLGAFLYNVKISPLNLLLAGAASAAFFLLLVGVTRGRGMGSGDITLAFFLGLWLGWPKIAVAVWLGFLIGAIWGIGLILLGRKKFGQTVPFGPFLIVGSLLAQQWGQEIIDFVF